MRIYIYLAAAAFIAFTSATAAWKVQSWRHDAQELARVEDARELAKLQRQAANSASAGHEADKTRIETEFLTITQEVERVIEKPVYRNICLDPDGLRAHAAAVRATGNTGEPGHPVPAAAAPE